jgi:hypothetical protein
LRAWLALHYCLTSFNLSKKKIACAVHEPAYLYIQNQNGLLHGNKFAKENQITQQPILKRPANLPTAVTKPHQPWTSESDSGRNPPPQTSRIHPCSPCTVGAENSTRAKNSTSLCTIRTGRHAGRHTDRHTGRHTDRQAGIRSASALPPRRPVQAI